MEQYSIQNLTFRYSPDFNYVWILLAEQTNGEQFAASLGDASFHSLLRRYNVKNVLLDCGKMRVFSIPEMTSHIDRPFAAAMRENGVEKVSVVVSEEVFGLTRTIFQGIASNRPEPPQFRFFSAAKFYESFESVDWF